MPILSRGRQKLKTLDVIAARQSLVLGAAYHRYRSVSRKFALRLLQFWVLRLGFLQAAWRNFSIGVGGQVRTVREQRSKRDAMAAPRAAWESVHRTTEIRWRSQRSARVGIGTHTTLATLDEQSRRQVGPKNLFDRPARDPHSPFIKISPWGR
jgi:hypothetical protein